jgi:hypothetical protein
MLAATGRHPPNISGSKNMKRKIAAEPVRLTLGNSEFADWAARIYASDLDHPDKFAALSFAYVANDDGVVSGVSMHDLADLNSMHPNSMTAAYRRLVEVGFLEKTKARTFTAPREWRIHLEALDAAKPNGDTN